MGGCDSRKWLLSKLLPSKFGDRVAAELTGDGNILAGIAVLAIIGSATRGCGAGGGTIKTETNFAPLKNLSTEDKFALREILMRASAAANGQEAD